MRNKIFGGIGILWGGALLVRWLMADAPASGASAYQSGQSAAVVFGILLLIVGLYYFFKKPA
jgi:LPXTG-motif cell wall-anchored protein